MDTRKQITDALNAKRKLTPSTLKTYVSLLNTLYTKLDTKAKDTPSEFFTKFAEDIVGYIEENYPKVQTRKTQLCALYVLTEVALYAEHMRAAQTQTAKEYAEHKRSDARDDRLKTFGEIKQIHEQLYELHRRDPTALNRTNLLISSLCSGVYNPPRRLLDWTELKIIGGVKNIDNYVSGTKFFLNQYKTAAKERQTEKGCAVIDIPKPILLLIQRTKKLEPKQVHLLLNTRGEKFTSSSLNKRLDSLFGLGIDEMRSIYLNDVTYAGNAQISKLESTADLMGNSVESQQAYYLKR